MLPVLNWRKPFTLVAELSAKESIQGTMSFFKKEEEPRCSEGRTATAATTTTAFDVGSGSGGGLNFLVPSFDPGKDDLLVYSQKVELLSSAWPEARIAELTARLILSCQGSAFQKLQQHQAELLSSDKSGVRKLIELLGGYWGRIPLEKKYETVEKAIFRCNQRGDETNDSFLARSDIIWSELLSKGTTLAEIQAYVILRGSTLSNDDKKRVIVESDNAGKGQLEMEKVASSIRLLGAGFFSEMVTGKRVQKQKTYDISAFTAEDVEMPEETEAMHVWSEEGSRMGRVSPGGDASQDQDHAHGIQVQAEGEGQERCLDGEAGELDQCEGGARPVGNGRDDGPRADDLPARELAGDRGEGGPAPGRDGPDVQSSRGDREHVDAGRAPHPDALVDTALGVTTSTALAASSLLSAGDVDADVSERSLDVSGHDMQLVQRLIRQYVREMPQVATSDTNRSRAFMFEIFCVLTAS